MSLFWLGSVVNIVCASELSDDGQHALRYCEGPVCHEDGARASHRASQGSSEFNVSRALARVGAALISISSACGSDTDSLRIPGHSMAQPRLERP